MGRPRGLCRRAVIKLPLPLVDFSCAPIAGLPRRSDTSAMPPEGIMRSVFACAFWRFAFRLWLSPVAAAPAGKLDINSREAALKWIGLYRTKPQPARMPELVQAVEPARRLRRSGIRRRLRRIHRGGARRQSRPRRRPRGRDVSAAAGRSLGDRAHHRLFRPAGLEGHALSLCRSHADPPGHDRQICERQDADLDRDRAAEGTQLRRESQRLGVGRKSRRQGDDLEDGHEPGIARRPVGTIISRPAPTRRSIA